MTVTLCPVCQCPTQPLEAGGDPLAGLRAHQERVHPDELTVVQVTRPNPKETK
jgi:hypothetical protein